MLLTLPLFCLPFVHLRGYHWHQCDVYCCVPCADSSCNHDSPVLWWLGMVQEEDGENIMEGGKEKEKGEGGKEEEGGGGGGGG